MEKELQLKLTVRLYTEDRTRCFGPGIATLLHRVEEHSSLRSAAASMEAATSSQLFPVFFAISPSVGSRPRFSVSFSLAAHTRRDSSFICRLTLIMPSSRRKRRISPIIIGTA